MSLLKIFLGSVVAGALLVLVVFGVLPNLSSAPVPNDQPAAGTRALNVNHALFEGVFVREQVGVADIARIKSEGFRTLIDLRPDGEASDQPSSQQIAQAAGEAGLMFSFVPTPHGAIPSLVVDDFTKALAAAERPVLLYCRSGKRASRVWALSEAGRADGPGVDAITRAVRTAGQPVDDILPAIEARIAARALSGIEGPKQAPAAAQSSSVR